jgi:molybdopterin-containing oxidoreductase family iron-sulfur binding subunit
MDMRYAMAIDISKCIGCRACAVACKANNNLPNGVWYNRVVTVGGEEPDTAGGSYPNDLTFGFTPITCQHCDAPPCVEVCPAEATWKEEETGIVVIDAEKCIGCKLCIDACPYSARSFNQNEPEYPVDFPLGDWDAPVHVEKVVEKCTFCSNRLARGAVPACMELCLARCRFWGDLDDPASEINSYLQGKETFYLLEEEGTKPATIYVK